VYSAENKTGFLNECRMNGAQERTGNSSCVITPDGFPNFSSGDAVGLLSLDILQGEKP